MLNVDTNNADKFPDRHHFTPIGKALPITASIPVSSLCLNIFAKISDMNIWGTVLRCRRRY